MEAALVKPLHTIALIGMLLLAGKPVAAQESVPEGFVIETVATGLSEPIALAFTPDGELLIGQRGGTIRVVVDDALLPEPFAELEVLTLGEGGLLGLAVANDFATNRFVYAFATVSDDEQQIIRLRDANGVGVERTLIRGGLPTTGSVHNGGGLRMGPDGMLYFAIGDTGDPELSQQMHTFAGKVCRITPDGEVPTDNPFTTPTGAPRAVYALGFRNPFRFCFDPAGRLFVGDVGSSGDTRREEINDVMAGGNYGWPLVEGFGDPTTDPALRDPLIAYVEEGSSIAGCTVYHEGNYPDAYDGNLFHLDFVSQGLFHLAAGGGAALTHSLFAQLDGGTVDLAQGPDGSLYYTEMFTGTVKRIRYTLAPPPPQPTDDDRNLTLDDEPIAQPPAPCGAGSAPAVIGMLSGTVMLRLGRGRRSANPSRAREKAAPHD
jgi:glucose/arabinose dehydrogenase